MSDTLTLAVWKRFPEGGSALGLMQAIAEAANEQGNCYVAVDRLACDARISRKSAFRALRVLREGRWVVSSRIEGQGGTQVFQLNLPKLNRSTRARHHETRVRPRCRRGEGHNGPAASTIEAACDVATAEMRVTADALAAGVEIGAGMIGAQGADDAR